MRRLRYCVAHTLTGRYVFTGVLSIDIDSILDKGLSQEENLTDVEWPVFVLAYFESIADMEGWDHFFTYSMKWYSAMYDLLRRANDFNSLRILQDYKNHFSQLGVEFTAQAIDNYLTEASDDYFTNCPDWRDKFNDYSEQRWELVSEYYKSIGVELKT
ncbi:hypothetical protein ACXHP7_06990 [Vibrio chemaguriensis]